MSDVSLRYLLFGEDRSASKSIKGVESAATRSGKAIGSSFAKMGSMIGGEVGDILTRAGEGITSLSESAKGMGPKLAAGGAAATGLGAALSMLGSKDKEAEAALQAAMAASGHSIDQYKSKIEEVVKEQENYGHSAADTQQALAALTSATNDPKKALESMGLVANIAASRHMSLQDAAAQVGKMLNGNVKIFKAYGIQATSTYAATAALTKAQAALSAAQVDSHDATVNLHKVQGEIASGALSGAAATTALKLAQKEATSAASKLTSAQTAVTKAHRGVAEAAVSTHKATQELAKRVAGQASASVSSFSGHLSVLKTKIEDNVAAFGNKYGPALQVAGVGMMGLAAAMEVGKAAAIGTRIQMAYLSAQTLVQSAVSKGAAAAQWLLNAAMEANPVGLIVAALVGLIAVFVLLYKHSTTFRNAMNAAFHAVTAAAQWAFDWIKQHWPLILAILTGPVGIAVLLIVKNWDKIRSGLSTVIDGAKGLWNGFMGFLRGIPAKVGTALSGMWSVIKDGFKAVLNGVIDVWNSMPSFHIPSVSVFGHKLGGGTIGLPHLAHLATGGVLTGAGAVVVGEHGREILDLPAGARVRPLAAMDTHGGGAGGDFTATAPLVLKLDSRTVWQGMLQMKRNSGNISLGLA